MATIGERLRQERETRGRTLEQMGEATGIGVTYLESLERDDFNALPGRAFGKLYIRAYAEALGFDPQPLVDAYDREQRLVPGDGRQSHWRPQATAAASQDEASVESPRTRRRLAAIAGIGIVAVVALYFGLRRGDVPSTSSAPTLEPPPVPASPAPEPAEPRVVEPSPVPPQPEVPGRLRVTESGTGRRVVRNRVEGATSRFAPGEVAWFQTRVVGGRGGETVRHVWIHEGRPQQSIALRLGGSDWRTHSNKRIYRTGPWTVEARDETGRVLASAAFTCGPAGD